jgi:hypothetical protein
LVIERRARRAAALIARSARLRREVRPLRRTYTRVSNAAQIAQSWLRPAFSSTRFRIGFDQMNIPLDLPRRQEFNDEVHARPPETLCAPLRLSYLALFAEGPHRQLGWDCVRRALDGDRHLPHLVAHGAADRAHSRRPLRFERLTQLEAEIEITLS